MFISATITDASVCNSFEQLQETPIGPNHLGLPVVDNNPNFLSPDSLNQRRGKFKILSL